MDKNELTKSNLSDDELTQVSGGAYVGPCFLYTVVKGDKIEKIADRYSTTVEILAELNHMANTSILRIGQKLLIPTPQA